MLKAAQMKYLDHTDVTTVREALAGLDIVQRSIASPVFPDDTKIAARLRQVATAVRSCVEPNAITAYADVATAAQIFQAMADGI
jgi:hypothetical protein